MLPFHGELKFLNNRPALCMGTAGRASVESLHALDSYQQSMPVNRACSLEMLSVTCKLGTYSGDAAC